MSVGFFIAWLGGFIAAFAVVAQLPPESTSHTADALLIVTMVGCIGLAYVAVRRHLQGTAALGGSGVIAIGAETCLLLLGVRLPEAFRTLRASGGAV
jgi:hypothetical protein